jgi:TIR domain
VRDVFLSYSRIDHREAALLYSTLRGADLTVWFDVKESIYGEPLREQLREQVELSRYFVALVTDSWLRSEYCRLEFKIRREFVVSNSISMNSFIIPLTRTPNGLLGVVRKAIRGIFDPVPGRLRAELKQFVYLNETDIQSSASTILNHIRRDGPEYVGQCSRALISGEYAEAYSDALARLLARYPTVSTIESIWEAAFHTKWPTICVDLSARALHYGMRDVKDGRVHAKCMEVIRRSVDSGNVILIDKFAYTAGNLQIYTWQSGAEEASNSYRRLIDEFRSHHDKTVSAPYIYTGSRVSDWLSMLGSKAERPLS